MSIMKNYQSTMRIKQYKKFIESISGTELVGNHSIGPNYPEQKLANTLSQSNAQILIGNDGVFYTLEDYQDLYNDYLKLGGKPLDGFTKINLDTIIKSFNQ